MAKKVCMWATEEMYHASSLLSLANTQKSFLETQCGSLHFTHDTETSDSNYNAKIANCELVVSKEDYLNARFANTFAESAMLSTTTSLQNQGLRVQARVKHRRNRGAN